MRDGLYVMRGGGFTVDGSDTSVENAGSGGVTIYNTCKDACTGNEEDKEDYWQIEFEVWAFYRFRSDKVQRQL